MFRCKMREDSAPSPRLSGERVGVRGFRLTQIGVTCNWLLFIWLLTPALSSFGEEREDHITHLEFASP